MQSQPGVTTLKAPRESERCDILQTEVSRITTARDVNIDFLAMQTAAFAWQDLKTLIRDARIAAVEKFVVSRRSVLSHLSPVQQ